MFKKLGTIVGTMRVLFNKDTNTLTKRSNADTKQHREQLAREKDDATAAGEPWVAVVTMDVDYGNMANGNFELDWNDLFTARLVRHGFKGKTDADLVDQWFNDVCRNIVLETYEQGQADLHPTKSNSLGGGLREYK
jgi:hypothetical protein